MLKIILIDDDDIVLMIQRKLLQRCGINNEILSFKKGREALDFLLGEIANQNFLILLDINMPVMNGWQFLYRLAELEIPHDIKVVMVTSSVDSYDREAVVKYDKVIGFIEKPITAENCENLKKYPSLKRFF
ncbi:response regulator [Antarcticibacterium flavum]|uniref:Response regulator n=1 Tax=Antarcticibacterium flavum TaxID=2058175 RepID=A0A5B7X1Q9_9FLAO|nr:MULTISPECIES: response regulator [Antarcticibacterium]MCM4158746.1 response regulator [Antarcticibacterium sp. W02-3]QCY68598.1 response regulator [Antarcticibacterium flavum]